MHPIDETTRIIAIFKANIIWSPKYARKISKTAVLENEEGAKDYIEKRALIVLKDNILKNKLLELFNIQAEISIIDIRYHSLEIIFGVAFTAYSILSGYSGIYESIEVIRQQTEGLLFKEITSDYPEDVRYPINELNVSVDIIYPKLKKDDSIIRDLAHTVSPLSIDINGSYPLSININSGIASPPRTNAQRAYPINKPRLELLQKNWFFIIIFLIAVIEFIFIAWLVQEAVIKAYLAKP